MKKILFLTAMLFSSVALAANGDSYFGGGYHMGNYDESGLPTANPSALKIEYGQYINDSIAIEGHFVFGMAEDNISVDGLDVELEVKQAISIFIKGDVNLNKSTNFYGLLGFTKGKLEASIPDFNQSISEDDSGLSYGLGLEAETSTGIVFSGEYIMYLSEDEYDYSGFNFGIAKKF